MFIGYLCRQAHCTISIYSICTQISSTDKIQ